MAKNQTLSGLIKEIKFRSNLTQSEIATLIGVSKQYLSDTLNGRYPFNEELKQKLYEHFTYLNEVPESSPVQTDNQDVNRLLSLLEASNETIRRRDEQIDRLITLLEKETERTEFIRRSAV